MRDTSFITHAPSTTTGEDTSTTSVFQPCGWSGGKVFACVARAGKPKAFTDRRDLAVLLLAFPELKSESGPVRERLEAMGAGPETLAAWSAIAREEILPEDEDAGF